MTERAPPRIRPATRADDEAVWTIIAPMLREGATWALPPDWDRADALAYWFTAGHAVFLAEDGAGAALGSYYLRANQRGGGAHVANCGYVTAPAAAGRGVARAMCRHSLDEAAARGFAAMQFNFVVSTNERAVALWERCGFAIVGRVPGAFRHPQLGEVDVLVMHRRLGAATPSPAPARNRR